jgi:UDP-glucose 4-epimerase
MKKQIMHSLLQILDNLHNSSEEALVRLKELAGEAAGRVSFVKGDLCDAPTMEKLLASNK